MINQGRMKRNLRQFDGFQFSDNDMHDMMAMPASLCYNYIFSDFPRKTLA